MYRGVTSDFNAAMVIATVGGNFFYDKSTSPALIQYYYWITIVSVNGTVGAPIGPASAIAKPPIASVIEGLTAQIDAGLLAQSLKTEIDKITLNYAELTAEIANRIAGNSALSAALADVQNGLTQSLALVDQEIILRQDGDSALATQLNTVAAVNAQNAAAILTEQTARVTADSALSTDITTVAATAGGKNKTYSQAAAPTGTLVAGDLWFDTDDNKKAYRYSGSAWVATDDARIASTAAALTTEQTARANGDSALASQITTAQSTLNGSISSVQTTLQTNINTVDGTVTQIGARYTAVVSVNGLVGGFGVYNNGTTIEAGFDVDTFWVGKTQANKRKPFIISGGVTYIDDAAIEKLTFTKLRDATGAVVIENGKIKANYLQVNEIYGGAFTGYAWPAAGVGNIGFYLGPSGLLLGNFNNGKYFAVEANGNVYAPGFSVVGGTATFSGTLTANVVNTANIVGAAVTSSYIATSGTASVEVTITVPAGSGGYVILVGLGNAETSSKGGTFLAVATGTVSIDGVGTVAQGSGSLVHGVTSPAAGNYRIVATRSALNGASIVGSMTITVLVNKR